MGGTWVHCHYLARNARIVGQNNMTAKSDRSISFRKIVPLTGAVFVSSLCTGSLTPPIVTFDPSSSFNQTLQSVLDCPISLSEREFDSAEKMFGDGIGWTVSDLWFAPVRNSIRELLSLAADWDSYGASRVEPAFAASATTLLQTMMDAETPIPSIVPTASGGVQIEWHVNGIDLEVEVESTSRINVLYEDLRTGFSWETEFTSDLQKLRQVVATLSR